MVVREEGEGFSGSQSEGEGFSGSQRGRGGGLVVRVRGEGSDFDTIVVNKLYSSPMSLINASNVLISCPLRSSGEQGGGERFGHCEEGLVHIG